jgi:AhpD family alkylhydroperoxidase
MVENAYPELYAQTRARIRKLRQRIPEPMAGYAALHEKALADGALDRKTKELIALGIAISIRCDGCIAYHVHDALQAGATETEVAETIGVAVLMGGGPSVIYGAQAAQALEQFAASRAA